MYILLYPVEGQWNYSWEFELFVDCLLFAICKQQTNSLYFILDY